MSKFEFMGPFVKLFLKSFARTTANKGFSHRMSLLRFILPILIVTLFTPTAVVASVTGQVEDCDVLLEAGSSAWTPDLLEVGFLALLDLGFQFSSTSMRAAVQPFFDGAVSEALGFPTTVNRLYRQAVKRYGTLQGALDTFEIDYQIQTQYGVASKWTKPLIERALRVLYDNRFKPSRQFLGESRDERARKMVVKAVGFETSLISIYNNAQKLYDDGLFEALQKAGLPAREILAAKGRSYWNKRLVKKGLQALYNTGYEVNATALMKSKDPTAIRILSRTVGFKTALSALYVNSVELYESFPSALRAADLPVEKILLRPNHRELLTPEKMLLALKALAQTGYDISALSLKKPSPKADKVISNAVGFRLRTRVLGERAATHFGSLQNAFWNKEVVYRALQALYKNNYLPNINFFKYPDPQQAEKVAKILREAVGFPVVAWTVYSQALRLHDDNFKSALTGAGLPVQKIWHVKVGQPWTKELVYLALQALYAKGYLPKLYFLQNSKDERAVQILIKVTGFETTLSTLLVKAKEFHNGKFDDALVGAGLSLEEIKVVQPRTPWTKEQVYAGLRALNEKGFTPSASFLQKSDSSQARRILVEAVGFETELSSLYLKACEFHEGDFQRAVKNSGLLVEHVVSKYSGRYWTPRLVYLALRVLYENGFRPYAAFLHIGRSEEAEQILKEALGFPVRLSTVYKKARELHNNSFTLALKAAGLPAEKIVQRTSPNPMTKKMVAVGLIALYESGHLPNPGLLGTVDPAATHVLQEALGTHATLADLHDQVLQHYGPDFKEALRQVGLPVDQILGRGPHRFWNKEFIIRALRLLYESGFTPYASYLRVSRNSAAEQILKRIVGHTVRLSALYVQAEGQFDGRFQDAIAAAGLPVEKIVLQNENQWTDEIVVEALKMLYHQGFRPNYTLLHSGQIEALRVVSDSVGFVTTPRILFKQARVRFGSLRQALLAGGLPADRIVYRFNRRHVDYSLTMPTQKEYVHVEGEDRSRRVTLIGETSLTPEEEYLRKELLTVLMRSVPAGLRTLSTSVLEVIFSFEMESMQAQDIAQILMEDKVQVTAGEIQQILDVLAQNQEFASYLRDTL
ncbi:MAG: hypothetical protein AB7N80_09595 [Bdellovibrionales bacterium]